MSNEPLIIFRGRTNVEMFDLAMDVTGDTLVAEIREEDSPTSTLIGTFTVTVTDAANGLGTLTLDDSDAAITQAAGYTDILRVTGGEPISVFLRPLRVIFRDMPTAVPA